jgi:glycosyltransferase involved in cell wall biosynthesis
MPDLKVIVAQIGARHNYVVPRMLHAEKALSGLYTDFCIHGWQRSVAQIAAPVCGANIVGKLRRRTAADIPSFLIRSALDVNVLSWLCRPNGGASRYEYENALFSWRMKRWGVRDANVVYAMWGSGSGFWRYAREQGLKVAVDVFITPAFHRIVAAERRAFPDWLENDAVFNTEQDETEHTWLETHVRDILTYADLLICPSQAVIEGVAEFIKQDSDNRAPETKISSAPRPVWVPYGNTLNSMGKVCPHPGRILYAGIADVRKGIHYLAKAAILLRGCGKGYEVRVAGVANDTVRNHPDARVLTFLGHITREQIIDEYRLADIFVLPTLAEGSASVVFEALSAGLPVVTTRSAGSVVTNGREGYIVPERDAEALAEAIERIVEDRALRASMAEQAKVTAAAYDEQRWRRRLVGTLDDLRRDVALKQPT